jgi:hypothetical protein
MCRGLPPLSRCGAQVHGNVADTAAPAAAAADEGTKVDRPTEA